MRASKLIERTGIFICISAMAGICWAQCNAIDAKTSASFKVTSGQACATASTYINWTFTETNGTMTINWGTTTSFGSSADLYSASVNTKFTFTGIQPARTYYFKVAGVWNGITHNYPSTGTYTFATPATIAIIPTHNNNLHVISHAVSADIYTVSGQLLAAKCTPEQLSEKARLAGNNCYLVKYYSESGAILGTMTRLFVR